jgi:hypothetical protein
MTKPTARRLPQAGPEDTIVRILRYRLAVFIWHSTGRFGAMPQPRQHGLNLPDLKPSEFFWGVA